MKPQPVPVRCAVCGKPVCNHSDLEFAGIVPARKETHKMTHEEKHKIVCDWLDMIHADARCRGMESGLIAELGVVLGMAIIAACASGVTVSAKQGA